MAPLAVNVGIVQPRVFLVAALVVARIEGARAPEIVDLVLEGIAMMGESRGGAQYQERQEKRHRVDWRIKDNEPG